MQEGKLWQKKDCGDCGKASFAVLEKEGERFLAVSAHLKSGGKYAEERIEQYKRMTAELTQLANHCSKNGKYLRTFIGIDCNGENFLQRLKKLQLFEGEIP